MNEIKLSSLGKTWIFDLDGTLIKHNGYKTKEEILPGVKDFFYKNIKKDDKVVIMTARNSKQAASGIRLLEDSGLRYDLVIVNLPHGERLIYNDNKQSGLKTCYSFSLKRNCGLSDHNYIFEDKEQK